MAATFLPPCGLYRTKSPIGDVPAGRLVYFHNHGDPGPGVYLPRRWIDNQADFDSAGYVLPNPAEQFAASLESLPGEGFYRVTEEFYCCDKKCKKFEAELFVQLGYNGDGEPILFVPELSAGGIGVPSTGTAIDDDRLKKLAQLRVVDPLESEEAESLQASAPESTTLH